MANNGFPPQNYGYPPNAPQNGIIYPAFSQPDFTSPQGYQQSTLNQTSVNIGQNTPNNIPKVEPTISAAPEPTNYSQSKMFKIPPPTVPENKSLFRLFNTQTTNTTVFVGNISEQSNDNLVRHILQSCGHVVNWKRVQGANNTLQGFGFCEYADQEDALRALRVLNNLSVCDKPLLVKVDAKTRVLLDRYESDQRDFVKSKLKPGDLNESEQITNSRKIEDGQVMVQIKQLLNGFSFSKPASQDTSKTTTQSTTDNQTEETDEQKNLVSREIKHFRETNKESDKDRDRNNEPTDRRSSLTERRREAPRSVQRRKSRTPTPSDEEAREELYEKRRMERRRNYKMNLYQDRLRRWEAYERNVANEEEKKVSRENRRKIDREDRFKKMIELMKTYDDDVDDSKHYRGSALDAHLAEREAEMEFDERDRKREKDELANEAKKMNESISSLSELESDDSELMNSTDANIKDINVKLPHLSDLPGYGNQGKQNENDHRQRGLHKTNYSTGTELGEEEEQDLVHGSKHKGGSSSYDKDDPSSRKSFGFGLKKSTITAAASSSTTKDAFEDIFVADDKGVVDKAPKKVKLTLIDEETKMSAPHIVYGPESAQSLTPHERKKRIKKLVESIPTEKENLFKYDIKWFVVDQLLIEKRIKPWIKKRIFEYIGEEEATLIKFICQKIIEKSSPEAILKDITMILDEEAEVFIIKLWRLLIYETEALSQGLMQLNQ